MLRILTRRSFATKPQKKPEVKPKTAEQLKAKETKTKQSQSWSQKDLSTSNKDKSVQFFTQAMLIESKRAAQMKTIKRDRTVWEKQVGGRYQREISKFKNQEDYVFECVMRGRDHALMALPSEELRLDAMMGSKGLPLPPVYRPMAAWTPESEKKQ